MNTRFLAFGALLLTVSGCSSIPLAAYTNRGQPESLLDVSSEVVTVDLNSPQSIDEVTHWMETDPPTRAEIHCASGDPLCTQTEDVLKVYGLDYRTSAADASTVNLVYERIAARDCESRYIDNSINPYNLSVPTAGCSVSANMVQQVSDKRQFVNPTLLDYHDAQQLVSIYNTYVYPPLTNIYSASAGQSKTPTLASQTSELGN